MEEEEEKLKKEEKLVVVKIKENQLKNQKEIRLKSNLKEKYLYNKLWTKVK